MSRSVKKDDKSVTPYLLLQRTMGSVINEMMMQKIVIVVHMCIIAAFDHLNCIQFSLKMQDDVKLWPYPIVCIFIFF